jgi:hypothetical protein
VVGDGSRVEAGGANVPWEVGLVWHEFLRLSEVNEGADASGEELVKFLCGCFKRRPGVLACE